MKDDLQFYPTPQALAEKMRGMFPPRGFEYPLLEPSAGNGDLLKWFGFGKDTLDVIHCVELNETRAAALRGQGFPVVWNDFLTFAPVTPYRTIIMNPPFNSGALHLLKAISIAAPDAQICCLLNAETIRNPCNRVRQELLKTLEAQAEYKCEFVKEAFPGVNVEVAIVYMRTQPAPAQSFIFEHFKRSVVRENAPRQSNKLQTSDEIAALIAHYRVEVKSALALYDEVQNYQAAVAFDDKEKPVFEIEMPDSKFAVVKKINAKYWRRLFDCKSIQHLLTHAAVRDLNSRIYELRNYEFSEHNILQFKIELCHQLTDSIDTAIMKTWEDFTHQYSMENADNIHYYNGWKTNRAFKCNGKVIIPLMTFHASRRGSLEFLDLGTHGAIATLGDYEKSLNYLDTGSVIDFNMAAILESAAEHNHTRGIETHFFTVDCFKKGTVHLTFKSAELLKKFNIYCGRKFNWLPPSYGKKAYSDLDAEERAVVDSFEGEASYNETCTNRDFYLADTSTQLLLE